MRVKIVFLLIITQLVNFKANAQMHQIYIDPANPDNDVMKISMYKPSEGFVAFSNWVGYTTDSGHTYVQKYITNSNVDFNGYSVNLTFGFGISGVQAFNADTLLVYGDYGFVPAILYSTDQGNTFKLVYQSQLNSQQLTNGITDMTFPQNSQVGFAAEADRIIKTIDGGRTWNSIREDPNSFFSFIEPIDSNTLFVFSTNAGTPKLLSTINGGSSWQQVSIPAGQIDYASFLTSQIGWLSINYPAALFYTSNGGQSWTQENNPNFYPFTCTKMRFINDSTGYSIGNLFDVYKTSDSGKVWEPLPRDNAYSYLLYNNTELHFYSNTQFWAGGGHGFLQLTSDGGGIPLPRAYFSIDTTNVNQTGIITLTNLSRQIYQYKWFVNGVLASTSYNATYTHTLSSPVDSIDLIVTDGVHSDTAIQHQYFIVPNLPAITSFYPVTGSTGTLITITGSGLSGVNSVNFGGIAVDSFSVVSSTQINAVVGAGATGNVSVADIHGSYSVPGFTYSAPPVSPPPVIDSLSPSAGPVGTKVTISGKNFNNTPTNNIIYFGATKATVISSTSTQIVCKVPVGASFQPLSLLNTFNGLTGHSLKPFNVTFADSSNFTQSSFTSAYDITSNTYILTESVMAEDMDGDGKPDIEGTVRRTFGHDSLLIFRNTGSGNNFSFVQAAVVSGSGQFDINDLDGDGKPDIANPTNQPYINITKNNSTPGNFSFSGPIAVQCNGETWDLKIGDIDGDGKSDLVVGTYTGNVNNVAIIRNTSVPGSLSFGVPMYFLTSTTTPANVVAIGDLDGDGKADVISYGTNSVTSATLSCFHNTSIPGHVTFDAPVNFPVTAFLSASVILADIDGDNKLDVIVDDNNNTDCIFMNTSTPGNISFAPAIYQPALNVGAGGCFANLSGGILPDYAAEAGPGLTVTKNLSTPGQIVFDNPVTSNIYSYATSTGDFNGDGKTDIVLIDGSTQFEILSNNMGVPINFSLCTNSSSEINTDLYGDSYQWQQDSGTGFINISDNNNFNQTNGATLYLSQIPYAWNGYKYRCRVDNHYSSTFIMKVYPPITPTISISPDDSVICYGVPATFTATLGDQGIGSTITWQVNGDDIGPDSNKITLGSLNEGDKVMAILGANNCYGFQYDTSNVFTVHFSGTTPNVVIQASDTIICQGTFVTIRVLPVPGIVNPAYTWQVNSYYQDDNTDTFGSSTFQNGDQVKVFYSTRIGCIIPTVSNTITMVVNALHSPAVVIASSADSICHGKPVFFTASASDTGSSVTYQWLKNGITVGTNSQFYLDSSLNSGDIISASIFTKVSCAPDSVFASNTKEIYVISPISISGSISGITSLMRGQPTTIFATVNIADSNVIYQWQDSTFSNKWQNIQGATTKSVTYLPNNTADEIRCIFTGADPCLGTVSDTSNMLAFSIQNIPVADSSGRVKYYPNPVSKILFIDSLNLTDQWQSFQIVSTNGSILLNEQLQNLTSARINVEALAPGTYVGILRRETGHAIYFKFIKL